ncbi:MAG: LysM peptidoglycan-binding domain-containing protein [Pseudomonadota bacterium]
MRHARRHGWAFTLAGALALAACGSIRDPGPRSPAPEPAAPTTSNQAAPPPATSEPVADARGVITYPDYQVVLAQEGDTLDSISTRIGVPVASLASYNGLPSDWRPRTGDTLVVPPEARVAPLAPANATTQTPGSQSWSPTLVTEAIERSNTETAESAVTAPPSTAVAPLSVPQEVAPAPPQTATLTPPPATDLPEAATPPNTPPTTGTPTETQTAAPPASPAPATANPDEPVRHVVESGETIYSISRLYGVPVTAIAAWNGLGRDYTVRPGQTIMVPISVAPGQTAAVAPPPPSADDPLPPNPPRAALPDSPELDQYRTDTATPAPLLQPVDGPVIRGYQPSGPDRNDGIDIAADPGTPVLAADTGEVALISNSLGSLGKIVLIRHASGLTTVYGRIDGVTVRKGEVVARGQVVGVVANTNPASLHFEVRRGAQSVDPAGYL